jgi:nucleoside-diphosphate-sugar epimerase
VHADRADLPPIVADAVVDCRAISKADVEGVLRAVPDVPTVVLSSVDVYPALKYLNEGRAGSDVPIDEDSPVRDERYPYRGVIAGMDDYEKLDCEPLYLARGGNVLRLPFVTGPHDYQRREEFVLRRIRAERKQLPIGAGTLLASRVRAYDVGTAVVDVLRAGVTGEIFTLAEHPTSTVRAWVEAIVDASGYGLELVDVADDKLPDDVGLTATIQQHLLVSSAKARSRLGWTPTPWRESVRESVEWHLANPPESNGDFAADDAALASV